MGRARPLLLICIMHYGICMRNDTRLLLCIRSRYTCCCIPMAEEQAHKASFMNIVKGEVTLNWIGVVVCWVSTNRERGERGARPRQEDVYVNVNEGTHEAFPLTFEDIKGDGERMSHEVTVHFFSFPDHFVVPLGNIFLYSRKFFKLGSTNFRERMRCVRFQWNWIEGGWLARRNQHEKSPFINILHIHLLQQLFWTVRKLV